MQDHGMQRRGSTLISVVVCVACVVVLIALFLPAHMKIRKHGTILKDSTQIKQIHQAWIIFSREFNGVFPTPGLIDRLPVDGQEIPGRGQEDISANTNAALHSICIMQNYYSPEILVGPTEPSGNVEVFDDYDWNVYDPGADVYWDPDLRTDLTRTSHVSYASMPLYGNRLEKQWRESLSPRFAVIGNRGPRDGRPDPNSITYRIHGDRNIWVGNVCYTDNHTVMHNTFTPEGVTYIDAAGNEQPDNLFRMDMGPMGLDAILSFTQEIKADGPVLQHD